MLTYTEAAHRVGLEPYDDLVADVEVPVLCGAQRQGDILIVPLDRKIGKAELAAFTPVPAAGLTIVRGTNDHILDAYQGDVLWSPATNQPDGSVLVGHLIVETGAVAYLTHTEEHGTNAIGPGVYRITGKREQADIVRRVAD